MKIYPSGLNVIVVGHTHTQTGDLISLPSLLESRLKTVIELYVKLLK
jgi:hypothetical protein